MATATNETNVATLARPWPRFWARLLDIQLYGVLVVSILATLFPTLLFGDDFQGPGEAFRAGFIALPFIMFLDAVILASTGSSPGKKLAGIRFADVNGQRVSISRAAKRNLIVYFRGLLMGIPFLGLIGLVNAYTHVRDSGLTNWDRATGTRVFASGVQAWRTWAVAALVILAIAFQDTFARAGEMGAQQLVDATGMAIFMGLFLGTATMLVELGAKARATFYPGGTRPTARRLTTDEMIAGLERIVADPSTADETRVAAEIRLRKLKS